MTVDNSLIQKLQTNDYKNDLMRQWTVFLSISNVKDVIRLYIQGQASDVRKVKAKLTAPVEDDVIWIDDEMDVDEKEDPKPVNGK